MTLFLLEVVELLIFDRNSQDVGFVPRSSSRRHVNAPSCTQHPGRCKVGEKPAALATSASILEEQRAILLFKLKLLTIFGVAPAVDNDEV